MNLNMNSRIENFEISDSIDLCGYLQQIVDEHYKRSLDDNYSLFKNFSFKEEMVKAGLEEMVKDGLEESNTVSKKKIGNWG